LFKTGNVLSFACSSTILIVGGGLTGRFYREWVLPSSLSETAEAPSSAIAYENVTIGPV
jgi:hypothetical protein